MDFKLIIGSKKTRYITLSFLIFILLLLSECKDKSCGILYKPIIPIFCSPSNDSFNIGDSFAFEIATTSKLQDFETRTFTSFNNFQFDLFLFVQQYLDTSKVREDQPFSPEAIEIHPVIGSSNLGSSGYFINAIYVNDSMKLKLNIKLLKSGLYSIRLINFFKINAHGGNNVKVTNSKCDEYVEQVYPNFNNDSRNESLVSDFKHFQFAVSQDRSQKWQSTNSYYYFYVK
ncbi:MAG: hypothetical protein PSX81_10105 [bacterium]|nr:hypothetical protein [bacterium]